MVTWNSRKQHSGGIECSLCSFQITKDNQVNKRMDVQPYCLEQATATASELHPRADDRPQIFRSEPGLAYLVHQ